MASTSTATSSSAGNDGQPEVNIVTEVPPSLHKALLLIVKNFFPKESYIIVYYIMKAVCIREERLRERVNYDQKILRQLLAALKHEKLVKERLISQKNESNRSVSIIWYFINYRAIINVLKYKIDHMRQKLEAREKEDVQKSSYKCTGPTCSHTYDVMEIDRIFDHATSTLKCWVCHNPVILDESTGPTVTTRSLLARFNEQMLPLFAVIRELAGVQLAPHLLEPDINKYMAMEENSGGLQSEQQLQLLDFSSNSHRAGLGGVGHSFHNAMGIRYENADKVTVELNADSTRRTVEEAKEMPTWLQDDAIGNDKTDDMQSSSDNLLDDGKPDSPSKPMVSIREMMQIEAEEEPAPKKAKLEEEEETEKSDEEEEEEEEMLSVQGQMMKFDDIREHHVQQMTAEEKEKYMQIVLQSHEDY